MEQETTRETERNPYTHIKKHTFVISNNLGQAKSDMGKVTLHQVAWCSENPKKNKKITHTSKKVTIT